MEAGAGCRGGETDAKQAGEGGTRWGGKGKNGKEKCGWMNEQNDAPTAPPAAAATLPEKLRRNATWRTQGEDQGRGGSRCRKCPLGQQPCGMAWAAAAGDDEGLRILLIQRRPAAMSPGQRHCSLPGAWRAPARVSLARSLHLLPLAVLQPVRNDAVSGPLPPFAPGPGSEQGAGRRMESARGEGRNRRKHPEAPPAGRAGPPPRAAPGGRGG